MGFSRGSERTVEILTPEKTTKTLPQPDIIKPAVHKTSIKVTSHKKDFEHILVGMKRPGKPPVLATMRPRATQKPVTQTVITYQKKRKTYRPRTSPSNKFLEAINDIERAVANARASGVRYRDQIALNSTLTKLKG
ncbi:Von Willebrand factor A, partial [Desmophyllum pertusum]